MSATKARRLVVLAIVSAGVVVIVALVFVFLRATRSDVGSVRRLPDGSTFQLRRVALITTNYTFSYETVNPVSRFIGRIVPFRNPWKSWSSGTLGFSTRGETNLLLITLHRSTNRDWSSSAVRFVLLDDLGQEHDGSWVAGTLGLGNDVFQGWQFRKVLPRSSTLRFHFLAAGRDGGWTNVAEFKIPNPLYP